MTITSDANTKNNLLVILALAAITLFVRFPYFFPAVINWDESSSILMGQSIVNGHLPYTELWNVKPPLLYYVFASFIKVFGHSIEGVRFGGTIFVALTAILTYFATRKVWDKRVSFTAAAVSIILMSSVGGGQSVMSEYVAMVPLMLALLILLRTHLTPARAAMVGSLLGAAGMVRLNLAFIAVGIALLILFHTPLRNGANRFVLVCIYAISGLAVVGATAVPHLLNGTGHQWLSAVFLAPMSYASSQHGLIGSLLMQGYYFVSAAYGIGLVVFVATLVYFKISGRAVAEYPAAIKTQRLILATFFVTSLISILFSGGAFQHYLIQICPFMAMFAAATLVPSFLSLKTSKAKRIATTVVCLIVLASLYPVSLGYYRVISRTLAHKSMRATPEYAIADYLRQHTSAQDGIYMMTDHIVYWFLNRPPIDQSVTHPSNIAKEYLLKYMPGEQTTTVLALGELLATEPKYIVKVEKMPYMDSKPEALDVLFEKLNTSYALETEIAGRQIYRHNN